MTAETSTDQFDPRSKLVLVMCISSLAVLLQDAVMMTAVLACGWLAAIAFGVDVAGILLRLRKLLYLFAAMAVIQSIFTPGGEVLVSLGGVSLVTSVGLDRGVTIILRVLIIVISAGIVTTASSRDVVQGLYQWGIPYEIAFMVALAIRFLPLLRQEAEDVLTAVQLRGLKLDEVPLGQRLQIYSYLLMPMVSSVLGKSQKLAIAVEMRAFRAHDQRTSYRSLQMHGGDYAVMGAAVAATAVFLLAAWRIGRI